MAIKTTFNDITFSVGDTVRVYQKIKEAGKTRLQAFEGVVIAIRGKEEGKSFTVRRIGAGAIGVERIWPLISPHLEKIQVVKRGRVRRAKLYYLRGRIGKEALRVKEKESKAKTVSQRVRSSAAGKLKPAKKDEQKKPGKNRRKSSHKISSKKGPKTS